MHVHHRGARDAACRVGGGPVDEAGDLLAVRGRDAVARRGRATPVADGVGDPVAAVDDDGGGAGRARPRGGSSPGRWARSRSPRTATSRAPRRRSSARRWRAGRRGSAVRRRPRVRRAWSTPSTWCRPPSRCRPARPSARGRGRRPRPARSSRASTPAAATAVNSRSWSDATTQRRRRRSRRRHRGARRARRVGRRVAPCRPPVHAPSQSTAGSRLSCGRPRPSDRSCETSALDDVARRRRTRRAPRRWPGRGRPRPCRRRCGGSWSRRPRSRDVQQRVHVRRVADERPQSSSVAGRRGSSRGPAARADVLVAALVVLHDDGACGPGT